MNLDLGNTITQAITIVYGEPFLDLHSDSQIPICLTDSRTPGTNVPGVFTQKKFCTKAYSSGTVRIEPRLETITMLAPVSQF